MSLPFILFFVFAFVSIAGALLLILAREPIHSALSLILVMMSLAVLYLMLGAEFIAAVQIIVYAGAIMVLFVFVIMLLNAGTEERTDWSKIAKYAGLPLGIFPPRIGTLDGPFADRANTGEWPGVCARNGFDARIISATFPEIFVSV